MRRHISSKRCAELLGLGQCGDGSVDAVQGLDHQHSAFNTVCHQWNSFRRSPSEEFGITVHSVCILTGTQTHLKLIQSCTIATGGSLTTSTLKLVGVTFFLAFDRPPPSYPWFGIHVPLPPCCDMYWETTGCTYTRDINHKCSFTGPTEMTGAKFWVRNNRMICNSVVSHSRDGRELHYSRHGLLHWCKLCLPQTCRVNTVSCFTCTHHWYVKQFVCSIVELANGMSDFIHPQQWGMSGHPCESLPICWLCCALKLTSGIKQKAPLSIQWTA